VRISEPAAGRQPAVMTAMYLGLGIATVILLGLVFVMNNMMITPDLFGSGAGPSALDLWLCAAAGAVVTAVMMWVTDVYTGDGSRFVDKIARASEGGHATNIISGLGVGMQSTVVPVLVIASTIVVCFELAGVFGVSIAAMSMLSLAGIVVSIDAYGPITDNAGGIAQMAELGDEVRAVTDPLDAFGNTTKAVTKGYAIASAGLAAVALFGTYIADLRSIGGIEASFALSNATVVAGLFIGAMIPFVPHLRRHRDPVRPAPDDRAGADSHRDSDRGGPHPRRRGARRAADRLDRGRCLRGDLDDDRRRRLGQRQKVHRERLERRQGLRSAQGRGDRRHRRRSLQGYRWPLDQPDAQAREHRCAAGDPLPVALGAEPGGSACPLLTTTGTRAIG
jgi:hypothetical protein